MFIITSICVGKCHFHCMHAKTSKTFHFKFPYCFLSRTLKQLDFLYLNNFIEIFKTQF